MKIVVIASLAYSLVNFRGPLLEAMVAAGHEVVALAPDADPDIAAQLSSMGVGFRVIRMDRTGTNPFRDLRTLIDIVRLLRSERPDLVLAYTQKPIIYGGIATRIYGGRAQFHALVSGLGHVFGEGEGEGTRHAALRRLTAVLYRVAVRRARAIFVFNGDDGDELRRHRIVTDQRIVQVPGSGVDTRRFAASPVPNGPPSFLMIARLMRDKGLGEFVAAARIVRARFPAARFQILGPMDANPAGIDHAQLTQWLAAGDVEYLGETRDVVPFLQAASVFVLPSYYREGLPRTILEAMACARPVITTDMPGCRDPIEHGSNGLLVPPRDAPTLAAAMLHLADRPKRIAAMGLAARRTAEARYDVGIVNAQLLREMGLDRDGAEPGIAHRRALTDMPLVEWTLAFVAIIALLPVLLSVALAVLVAMGRPILFVQQRSGHGGVAFAMVKFRTMRIADDRFGRPLADAQRLTRTGRVLRRARLDELPELWNVLRGEMALVGPRPLLPETVAQMGVQGVVRGAVRPGLTGWAQVSGNGLLNAADKVALDCWYVANRSLALDGMIFVRTLGVMIGGEQVDAGRIENAHAGIADGRG